jgi:DNA segregation ATPase FtsK/SpoIIIE-like protein
MKHKSRNHSPSAEAFEGVLEFCKTCPLDQTIQPRAMTASLEYPARFGDSAIRLFVLDQESVFQVRFEAPFRVQNTPKRFDVIQFFSMANSELPNGNFELDFDTGIASFRIAQWIEDSPLHVATIQKLVGVAIASSEDVFSQLYEMVTGKTLPEIPVAHEITEEIFDEDEELVVACLEIMRAENRASTALLQRRLKLGYTRAARVMDILESRGIVGPKDGANDREILVDLDEMD